MRHCLALGLAFDLCIIAWRLLLEASPGIVTDVDIDDVIGVKDG